MVAACKAKMQVLDGKVGAINVKVKVTTTQGESYNELEALCQ